MLLKPKAPPKLLFKPKARPSNSHTPPPSSHLNMPPTTVKLSIPANATVEAGRGGRKGTRASGAKAGRGGKAPSASGAAEPEEDDTKSAKRKITEYEKDKVLEWLEDGDNFALVVGSAAKKAAMDASNRLTQMDAFAALADFMNRHAVTVKVSTDREVKEVFTGDWRAGPVRGKTAKNRFNSIKKIYVNVANMAKNRTGEGITAAEAATFGWVTWKSKQEALCKNFDRWDHLFGSRQNLDPTARMEAGGQRLVGLGPEANYESEEEEEDDNDEDADMDVGAHEEVNEPNERDADVEEVVFKTPALGKSKQGTLTGGLAGAPGRPTPAPATVVKPPPQKRKSTEEIVGKRKRHVSDGESDGEEDGSMIRKRRGDSKSSYGSFDTNLGEIMETRTDVDQKFIKLEREKFLMEKEQRQADAERLRAVESERFVIEQRRLDMEAEDRKETRSRQSEIDQKKLDLEDKRLAMEDKWKREEREAAEKKDMHELVKMAIQSNTEPQKLGEYLNLFK